MLNEKEKSIHIYLLLMEEVKSRFNVINTTYHNKPEYPPALVCEICYLQFRLISEIIAVGCLILHGDIPHPKSLRKAYNPSIIMKHLEGLNPYFFPQAIEHTVVGKSHKLNGDVKSPQLDKAGLLKLWNISGDILHRAPISKLGKPPKTDIVNFSDIFEWSEKLTGLLNSHWITLVENKKGIVVSLTKKETNKAAASVLEFDSPDKIVQVKTFDVSE